jgi:hypothetical protein
VPDLLIHPPRLKRCPALADRDGAAGPIVRFLKRKPFSLNPFLYIGIISSTRRILMIEAEHSTMAALAKEGIQWQETWPVLAEIGTNVAIILALAIALRIVSTTGKAENEN